MRLNRDASGKPKLNPATLTALLTLGIAHFASCANAQTSDCKVAEPKPGPEPYQTLYLNNVTQQNDLNDLLTDLRNVLPKSRLLGLPSQNAISIRGSAEEIQLAQKILADLDRPKKTYRLTFTITDIEDGKRTGSNHFTLIAVAGQRTDFKLGSRVPILVGTPSSKSSTPDTEAPPPTNQVQYMDVGLSILATVESAPDGVSLRSKVEQSSLAEEKSPSVAQDPVIRQSTLDESSTLVLGKPLVLGSLDVPGNTRRHEVEVVAELVR
jgi:type II secretory pathway component GspD/PulD (secretin)